METDTDTDSLYVYGIISSEEAPLELDVETVGGGSGVYAIAEDPFAAVVSDIDETEPERTDEAAERHDEVLRAVMDHGDGVTIVPMAFGMAFAGEDPLRNVLRGGGPAFEEALEEIDGAVELGVQVVTTGETEVDAEAIEQSVLDRLEEISRDHVEGDRFSERLVCNHSYLVDREARDSFDEAVGDLKEELDDVLVRYTGPWAPYSFVDINIGASGTTEPPG